MKKLLLNTLLLLFFWNINSQNWGEQILNQPNAATNNFFGYSVDIDGDYAIVGAHGENEITGSAHIFKKDINGIWNHHQKIEAYIGKHLDEFFGWAVAIEGDFVFVSARTDRLNEEKFEGLAGSVMIYKKDANDVWNGIQRIRSSDITIGDNFGYDISVDGDFLVIGADGQDYDADGQNKITTAGAAYIFKKNINGIWNQIQKITPSHRAYSDNIGRSVSISGNYIILASENDTDEDNANALNGNGSAFVFKKNDNDDIWTEVQKLKPSNGESGSHFGFGDVTISGNFIAVGAKNLDKLENNQWFYGHVFIFKKNQDGVWNESQILKTAFPASNFGSGVSLDGNLLLVSAPLSRVVENGSTIIGVGLSYLYVKDANDEFIFAETIKTSEINANSTIGEGEWDGTPSTASIAISDNHFIIGAANIDDLINNPVRYNLGKAFISGNVEVLGLLNVLTTEDNLETSFNVYPNPIKDKLRINLANKTSNVKIFIFDVLGKIILEKEFYNISKLEFDFSFPKGIYLSKIILENKLTSVVKLIKN